MSARSYTGNEMVIAHFHDFYYLEALQAQMNMAVSANPELKFRHSFAKLESDVAEEFARMTKSMALRIYVYLWAAALGEARHADDYCEAWIKGFQHAGRHTVYGNAAKYMPAGENLQIVHDIYAQKWRSTGFGGQKWLEIVQGIEMYGSITDAAFIDHAADLEHNGGCVFNKDARDETGLYCYGEFGYDTLKSFLDYKFKHNILDSYPDEVIRQCVRSHGYSRIPVSRKVYGLVSRFSNVVKHIDAIVYLNPVLETLSDYTVTWGNETLETSGAMKVETVKTTVKTNVNHIGESTSRLRVGDTVIIIGYDGDSHNVGYVRQYMNPQVGKVAKVTKVARDDGGNVMVALDGYNYWWAWQWLKVTDKRERRERREPFSSHCDSCGDGLHEDDECFSGITNAFYCESCYNRKFSTCNKCGDEHEKDDLTSTPNHPTYFKLCDKCLHEKMFQCPDCEEWYCYDAGHYMRDTHEDKCLACSEYCRKCNEYYDDMQWHNEHEHTRTRRHELADPQSVIQTVPIKTGNGTKLVTIHTYPSTNPALFVYNIAESESQHGNRVTAQWAIYTPSKYWLNPHTTELSEAIAKMNKIAHLVDWQTVRSYKDITPEMARTIKNILGY